MAVRKIKFLIIGAGPAGYTAAIYAARASLEPVLVAGLQPGGQLMITTDVENYPGFADIVQGPWLMQEMMMQAEKVGTEIVHDTIIEANLGVYPFILRGDSGDVYEADSLVIATGAKARWLGLESEERFMGFGVSACATCDGFFFRDKVVAVVGGGNTAVEEALYLTNHASKVYLIHRRDSLRAEKILQDRLLGHEKVEVLWNYSVGEILGDENPLAVRGVALRGTSGNGDIELGIDGLFVAIGHDPATSLFRGQLVMDDGGYIETVAGSASTGVGGVFAAGDVCDSVYRQAVTAAGMGCMAALEAEKFLAERES